VHNIKKTQPPAIVDSNDDIATPPPPPPTTMTESPASDSSLDLISRSANNEEIPSASASPRPTTAADSSNPALALLDEQLAEDSDSDSDLPEFAGEDDRNAPEGRPKGQWRAWALDEEHQTVFDFGRWAWSSVMQLFDYTGEQAYILGGYQPVDARMVQDITLVHRVMLEYNPMIDNGITIEQWEELAESKKGEALAWLHSLRWDSEQNRSYWRYAVENPYLGLRPYRIFNVCAAGDREAAREWAWKVHRAVIYGVYHPNLPIKFPGPALFDVGPGGTEGVVWRLRQLGVFEGLRGLKFSRLPGNATLVDFVREMHAWIDEGDLEVLRSLPENDRIW
jgi:hypothetical protein